MGGFVVALGWVDLLEGQVVGLVDWWKVWWNRWEHWVDLVGY